MDKLELAIATDYSGESSRTEDLEHILKMVSQAGFTHIHWCHEWDGDYTYSTYEMQQIREWMDKYNLKAKSLHATIGTDRDVFTLCGNYRRDFTADCEYNRKAGVELIKNRVDLASVMGTSEIVLHLYVPYKTLEKEPERKAKFYENVKKSMDELQPYCLEKGVRICMENLFDMPMEYMEEQWDWFLANYPKEFLGFCLDSGHANMLWDADMIRIIRKYGERIYSVHLHDNPGNADSHDIPGMGNINWEETMAALAASAYELPLTMELSCHMDSEEAFLKEAYKKGAWITELYQNALLNN